MNLEVLLVGGILAAAVVLFVTEKVRVDLVALMVMLGLVVAGILEGEEAIMASPTKRSSQSLRSWS